MTLRARVTLLPCRETDPIQLWALGDGGLEPIDTDVVEAEPAVCIALVAPEDCVVRHHRYDGLAERQAEAAARVDAMAASIEPSRLHVAASATTDTLVESGTIDLDRFSAALARLQAAGIDPDQVWPFGLVIPDHETANRAQLGATAVIRSGPLILPDDAQLTALLIDGKTIRQLDDAELADCLRAALADPPVNLRSGAFAKKRQGTALDHGKLRTAAMIGGIALLLSLLLAIASWFQARQAVQRENAAALAAARSVIASISSAEEAPARLERQLVARGSGKRSFGVAAAAVWQSLRQSEGASLRDLRFGEDRILSLTLVAASVDPINRVLTDLQAKGFKVTATPRQETNGTIAAAITVRAP